MIEIEQQFPFDPKKLQQISEVLGKPTTNILSETYFDEPNFKLLKNDTWLRNRNRQFELKFRRLENRGQQLEIYTEITTETEIKQFLKISASETLENWIKKNLLPIISIQTVRQTFLTGNLIVDVDLTDFDYSVCEIEYSGTATEAEAQKQILKLAKQLKLQVGQVKNKAKAYVLQKYPSLTNELTLAGIF